MMNVQLPPIGGYLELALPVHAKSTPYQKMHRYNSARGALLAVLLAERPNTLWLPRYSCDALLRAARCAEISVRFYELGQDLSVNATLNISSSDRLLYINYFGLCEHHCLSLTKRYPTSQLIIDNSQAFFSLPLQDVTTIYSPRKFFGLPDGGFLSTMLDVEVSEPDEVASMMRSRHLLKRLAVSPEYGYEDFLNAERSLDAVTTAGMSMLTRRLWSSLDLESSRRRRTENFRFLNDRLSLYNSLNFCSEVDGPLCYPLLVSNTESERLRSVLRNLRIYVPRYWPEVAYRAPENSLESQLSACLLPLPCDQRYDPADLIRMTNAIEHELSRTP